ncbi:hypothetical protein V6N13_043907 [Hibiscus sabdariffa]
MSILLENTQKSTCIIKREGNLSLYSGGPAPAPAPAPASSLASTELSFFTAEFQSPAHFSIAVQLELRT